MLVADAKKLVGKVVVLDLINGEKVTTRVEAVADNGQMKTRAWINFMVIRDPSDPQQATMMPVAYGAPLYQSPKNVEIEVAHVLLAFSPPPGMEEAYTKITSGVVLPPTASGGGLILP